MALVHRTRRMLCLIAALLLWMDAAGAQTRVVVASETWDRLLYLDSKDVPRGTLADFIDRMNAVQNKFHFDLVVYPRVRLDQIFIAGQADVYPLRTLQWTSPALRLLATRTILSSGDVYVARRDNRYGGRAVFADLKARQLAGVRGYHYQLFGNNPDENFIRTHFHADLLPTNEAVMKMVLAGRADVGIVPEMIVARYRQDPALQRQLIVAGQFDSHVDLSNLVREGGPISVAQMDAIVELLVKAGDVDRLKARIKLQPEAVPPR
jgi:ABC-type amino acid transport substrate-binding protein